MLVAFKDPKCWFLAMIVATHAVCIAGFGVFLPTFIRAFGFSPRESCLLPSPPLPIKPNNHP